MTENHPRPRLGGPSTGGAVSADRRDDRPGPPAKSADGAVLHDRPESVPGAEAPKGRPETDSGYLHVPRAHPDLNERRCWPCE